MSCLPTHTPDQASATRLVFRFGTQSDLESEDGVPRSASLRSRRFRSLSKPTHCERGGVARRAKRPTCHRRSRQHRLRLRWFYARPTSTKIPLLLLCESDGESSGCFVFAGVQLERLLEALARAHQVGRLQHILVVEAEGCVGRSEGGVALECGDEGGEGMRRICAVFGHPSATDTCRDATTASHAARRSHLRTRWDPISREWSPSLALLVRGFPC